MSAAPRDLMEALPHRPPFRFLSQIVTLVPGERGQAIWRVGGDEWFFAGHFPGRPIVPGVLLIEALAQLSGLIGLLAADNPLRDGEVSQIEGRLAHAEVRFKASIAPPAEIALHSILSRRIGALAQFEVRAGCGESVAASGTLTLAALRG